jgi:hypothetical protein
LQAGINFKIVDLDSTPYQLWGRIKRRVGRWILSAKVDSRSEDFYMLGIDLQAASDESLLQVTGLANVDSRGGIFYRNNNVIVNQVRVTQQVRGLGGDWTIAPSYNVQAEQARLGITLDLRDTILKMDASTELTRFTVSQKIGLNNAIVPSITTDGDYEIEYRRAFSAGTLAVNWRPDDSITMKWREGVWQATVQAPISGYRMDRGVSVNLRRSVDIGRF